MICKYGLVFFIIILEWPAHPHTVRVKREDTNRRVATVTWKCKPSANHQTIQGWYEITSQPPTVQKEIKKRNQCIFTGLDPNQEYKFFVKTVNAIGASDQERNMHKKIIILIAI